MKPQELRIRTPEGITFAYRLASPVTRAMAWGIDFMMLVAGSIAIMNAVVGFGMVAPDLAGAVATLSIFALSIGYGITLEWLWRGQTVGKWLLRLRVMDADGLKLQFHQVLLRNLIRLPDQLPLAYLVGGLVCLFSRRAQRLGDLAAGTIVVHHRDPAAPDFEQLLGTRHNSLRDSAHLCARLRQRTTPQEARIALQALMRRDFLEPAERVRVFAELADHFKDRTQFPHELVESVPDEQFVRDVVDVLFRTSESRASKPELEPA